MKISNINNYNNFRCRTFGSIEPLGSTPNYHEFYKNSKKKHIKIENNGQFLQNNQINCQPLKPR